MLPEQYVTMSGEIIPTDQGFAPSELRYLERGWELYQKRVPWQQFQAFFTGRGSSIWFKDGYVGCGERQGNEILNSSLYRILRDLNGRLAVEQGSLSGDPAAEVSRATDPAGAFA